MIDKRLEKFRLSTHAGSHPRPVNVGIPFLGFIVFPDRRRLKRRKGIYFQRKLRKLVRDYHAGLTTEDKLHASIRGWLNHIRYGNTVGLAKSILGRYRLNQDNKSEDNVWT